MHSTTADMISAASSLQAQGPGGPVALADRLPLHVLKRRLAHRRHTLAMQVASYALGATVLLIYVHAGTIPTLLPTAFLLCGIALIVGLYGDSMRKRLHKRGVELSEA